MKMVLFKKGGFLLVLAVVLIGLISCMFFDGGNGTGPTPPPGTVLFFDDFEDGADPAWKPESVAQGQWVVKDGAYTIENAPEDAPLRTFVGDSTWRGYSIEVDIVYNTYGDNPWRFDNQVAIFIRVQDENNMVAFFFRTGGTSTLKIKKAGIWYEMASAGTPNVYGGHILITANGSTYSAYLNGNLIAEFEDTENSITQGYAGLQTAYDQSSFWSSMVAFDNFSVQAL